MTRISRKEFMKMGMSLAVPCANCGIKFETKDPKHTTCPACRKSKYRARKTIVDGINFDSKKEADHYSELVFLQRVGDITDLRLQPVFVLQDEFVYDGKKEKPITYRADFSYTRTKDGVTVVEDVKGMRTDVYLLKRKLFLFRYPDTVFREV